MAFKRSAFVIPGAGLVTFVVVFTLMEFSPSVAAPSQSVTAPAPSPEPPLAVAADSLAPRVHADRVAVGVPTGGSESLLRDVQVGDRLDILASLPSPQDAGPVTSIVVRGASVLRAPSAADPLLLEVPGSDAVALAHLILSGTHLGYIVWPADALASSAAPLQLDQQTVRSLLGLSTPPTIAPVEQASPTPVPPPQVRASGSGFLYQAQPGDTWDSVATIFGITSDKLRQWNEVGANDEQPVPGRLVFIPRSS
jgi:hypothetical protein